MDPSLRRRFAAKVERRGSTECWPWRASVIGGYGYFWAGENVDYYAHRWAWRLHRGAIPGGLCVLHRCDNPRCCNPRHLFLGTTADNVRDMVAKGRARSARGARHGSHLHPALWRRGEAHEWSKLNATRVRRIRRLALQNVTVAVIAGRLGVSVKTIRRVLSGETWHHVA
jgi:hypothetical protein